jgi:hypothetical protein
MQTRNLLFAVTMLAVTACQEDMTEEKATWDATTKGWAARMEKMKKGHEELAAKVKAFTVPEGEAALATEKATLDKALETGTTALANAEKDVAAAKTTIEGLISQGKRVKVEVALGTTKSTVDGALSRAESLVSAANEALDMLSKKADAARGAAGAAKSRTDAWLAEVKKKGAAVMIDDLVFKGEVLDVENSKVALSSLVATLKSCADLKVELTVVALSDAADLGTKRAEALKAHLTANGVNAAVLAKVVGSVVKEGEEKVSLAVTTPCK